MAFPQSRLGILAEMFINSAWVDVTSRIRLSDKIKLKLGYPNEQGNTASPDTADFTINNRDGLFSNRNPSSIYYGLLKRNTPFRVAVTGTSTAVVYPPASETGPASVTTADKASVRVVGDIDVRVEVDPDQIVHNNYMLLAGKYEQGTNQRSWLFYIAPNGLLTMQWSTNGTTIAFTTQSTIPLTNDRGKIALRAVIDVDNGAAGNSVFFYTASTIGGAYTQLGTTVVNAGITSVFGGTAPLSVGNGTNMIFTAGVRPMIGRITKFELRNGIAGTVVATMDATAQASGTTSWADASATPNTWSVVSPAELTANDRRFYGEISEFPSEWDSTGKDVYVRCTASTVQRRLTQGASPVVSPIYRYLSNLANTTAYFPLEKSGASGLSAGTAAILTNIAFATDAAFLGSSGYAVISSATSFITGTALPSAVGSYASFVIYFKFPSVPGSESVMAEWFSDDGPIYKWQLNVSATSFIVRTFDRSNVAGPTTSTLFGGASPDAWTAMRIQISLSGGFIVLEHAWYPIGSSGSSIGYTSATFLAASTLGRFTRWQFPGSAATVGLGIAHVDIGTAFFDVLSANFYQSTNGYIGERAGDRFLRICTLAGVTGVVLGYSPNSVLMGPQPVGTAMAILQECADADDGMLLSPRTFLGIMFRLRHTLYAQGNCFDLNFAGGGLSAQPFPIDDDQLLRNDVTITTPQAGLGRSVRDGSTNGVSDVGRYDTGYSLNLNSQNEAKNQAELATFKGTFDALRYPKITVELARSIYVADPTTSAAISRIRVGDFFRLTNMPARLPPDSADLLARGIIETLENRGWTFEFNTQPSGPYKYLNQTTFPGGSRSRASATFGTTVMSAAGVTTTATSFVIETALGRSPWTTTGVPLQITCEGELMTVGAIGAVVLTTVQSQTFSSVTRSVNGVVKAHGSGAKIQIVDGFYTGYAL